MSTDDRRSAETDNQVGAPAVSRAQFLKILVGTASLLPAIGLRGRAETLTAAYLQATASPVDLRTVVDVAKSYDLSSRALEMDCPPR